MEILQLIWWPANEAKLRREHGITAEEVAEMVASGAYLVGRHADYPDQVRITGYTAAGRWLTIALEDLGDGIFRPVTGWVATEDEIRRFVEGT